MRLCFVLLSEKRRRDYKKVLEALKSLLPGVPLISGIVIYFQSAIWRAVQEIVPDADNCENPIVVPTTDFFVYC